MELKERISAIKTRFGLNSSQLSKKAKVTRQTISNIESGVTTDPKVSLLANIASELDINPAWLMMGKGEMILKQASSDCEKRAENLEQQVELLQKEVFALKTMLDFQNQKIQMLESSSQSVKLSATDVAGSSFGLIDYMDKSVRDFRDVTRQASAYA